jgi:hypothetical protein
VAYVDDMVTLILIVDYGSQSERRAPRRPSNNRKIMCRGNETIPHPASAGRYSGEVIHSPGSAPLRRAWSSDSDPFTCRVRWVTDLVPCVCRLFDLEGE